MNLVVSLRNVTLAAAVAATSVASAAPAHNVCVPRAVGLPTRPGPPEWLNWSGTSTTVDAALDDPRWLGATAQSFELGSARAPLHARALWATQGTQKYLYLSFIVDLEGLSTAGVATPRGLFLGFRRPAPFTHGNSDPSDDEYGYVFHFHLTTGAASGLVEPTHCTPYASCDESSATPGNFWRMFVDRNQLGSCTAGASTVNGPSFVAFTGGGPEGAPINWMKNEQAVRYWKLDATQPPLLQNRWAVQLRLKVASADNLPLEDGIPPGATFWYQGVAELTGTGGGPYAALGWWPRELTEPVCVNSGLPNMLVHPQLGDAASGCAGCSLDNYSRITTFTGTPPSDCDKGITIRHQNIGAVFDMPASTDFAAVNPTTSFKATRPDGTVAANTVIAQPVNLGPTDVVAPLMARFRLASWGSAPYTPGDTGKWKDMRGAENGVCASGTPPTCTPAYRVPGLIDANNDGLPDPGTNNRGAITFQWTIGNDPTIGASEYCKFGLTPPGGSCSACSCAGEPNCDAAADAGTQATVGATVSPCVSRNYEHQCMFVELLAPNGGVNFVQQSSWNNMNFDQMSVVSREALIDARQLPFGKDQKEQDIYLIVMPRNMPKSVQITPKDPTSIDGTAYIRERALARAEVIAAPYIKDIAPLNEQQILEIAAQYNRQSAPVFHIPKMSNPLIERFKRVQKALIIMPEPDFRKVGGMLKLISVNAKPDVLTEALVREIGPVEAAGIVPTLEIYPFYRNRGAGNVYMPMSAFSVFLSHEGSMSGMTWAIDGASQVGRNIYRLKIPVGFAKRIQVRAQAIEGNDALLTPPNPRWPCAGGGCCPAKNCGLVGQLGNGLPGLLAGIFVVLRGRRRRRPTLTSVP